MKKYKLKKWYPSLPNSWDVGTTITFCEEDDAIYNGKHSKVTRHEVENNPEFWEEIIEKDYKILSFRNKRDNSIIIKKQKTGFWSWKEKTPDELTLQDLINSKYSEINSVKRLSDGEVFTLGDKMYDNDCKNIVREIVQFNVATGSMSVLGKHSNGTCLYSLSTISHAKEPLFTTEDGVDIHGEEKSLFGRDKCFAIDTRKREFVKDYPQSYWGDCNHWKYFASKEKALEYLERYEPKYSLADIEKAYQELHSSCRYGDPFGHTNFSTLKAYLEDNG